MMAKESMEPSTPDASAPRRNFLSALWLGLGLAALAEWIWMLDAFLRGDRQRRQRKDPQTTLAAGAVDAFSPGSVTAFPRGRFYLARLDDGGFLALSRRCPHLGCTLPWIEEEKRFRCPCHSSTFDIRGDLLDSPAPRAMDLYPVVIENDVVSVETRQVVRRGRFKPTQVVYPLKT
jgi:cytochrome b6-f complex iron-sulfur subunit